MNYFRMLLCADCGREYEAGANSKRCPECYKKHRRIYEKSWQTNNCRPAEKIKPRSRPIVRYDPVWLYNQIKPGMRKTDITNLLGRKARDIETVLCVLENRGLLLSEDERGRLYPFVLLQGKDRVA